MGGKRDIEHRLFPVYPQQMRPADPRIAWSGMLHVRPLPGHTGGLEGAAGAYVLVFALAGDEEEYRALVAVEMASLGLFIAEVEHIAPYESHKDDAKSIRQCAARLSPKWPVQYDDFHAYPHSEL